MGIYERAIAHWMSGISMWGWMERRQRRGAGGAPVVEKRTERGQGALLGLSGTSVFEVPEIGESYQFEAVRND